MPALPSPASTNSRAPDSAAPADSVAEQPSSPANPLPEAPRSYAKVMDFLEKEGLLPAPAKEGTNGAVAVSCETSRAAR